MATRLHIPVKQFSPQRPPVVLMGGINLIRALGLAGIPAIVVSSDPYEPAFASRYCMGRCILPPLDNAEAVVDALVALGDRLTAELGRRVPLMYGSDDALEIVNAHRERLQRYYLFQLCDRDVGTALIAKDSFDRFARDRGLPVPKALEWEGIGPGTVRGTPHQVLAKPRTKMDWHGSQLCERLFNGDGKARVFESGTEAASNPAVAMFHDQLLFQEYIPGDDTCLWSYHGYADEKGQVLMSYVGRKIRTYPAGNGESAFIELAQDESLEQVGREVVARCPLKGPFKMDFKRDPRDGSWHLLEINARYNLWNYLGAANGVNLMQAAYEYLVDRKLPEKREPHLACRWLSFQLDSKAYRELRARGELTTLAWIASIVDSRNIYNIFSWSDPWPWLAFWSARFTRRGRRAGGKLMTAVRQWRSTAS